MGLDPFVAVEKMLGVTVPERCQYYRVILGELARICDHMICSAAMCMELGAFTPFLYMARAREIIWDIFEEDCYAAARTAGVLENGQLDRVRDELEAIRPMPAVFDQRYVKRLQGPNVKNGKNKRDLAEQVIADIGIA